MAKFLKSAVCNALRISVTPRGRYLIHVGFVPVKVLVRVVILDRFVPKRTSVNAVQLKKEEFKPVILVKYSKLFIVVKALHPLNISVKVLLVVFIT